MQKYNPYNKPGNKYRSDKPSVPNVGHDEYNPEEKETKELPDSYGLYIPPPLYETGMYKVREIVFELDSIINKKRKENK